MAEAPGIVAKFGRQPVRLAQVARAVKGPAAGQTARRKAGLRLRRVDPLQESPHPGVGQDGMAEQLVRLRGVLVDLVVTETSPLASFLAKIAWGHPPQDLDSSKRITPESSRPFSVTVGGFGRFARNERPTHEGRNPRTGERIAIGLSSGVSIRAARALKDALN